MAESEGIPLLRPKGQIGDNRGHPSYVAGVESDRYSSNSTDPVHGGASRLLRYLISPTTFATVVALVLFAAVGFITTSRTIEALQRRDRELEAKSNIELAVAPSIPGREGVVVAESAPFIYRVDLKSSLDETTQHDPAEEEGSAEGEGVQEMQHRQKQQQQQQQQKEGQQQGQQHRMKEEEEQQAGVEGWRSMSTGSSPGNGAGQRPKEERATKNDDAGSERSTTRPNVFFFLIDDMGFGDIGYQSVDLFDMTPNLDALAAGGIKLNNYYSMSICTPARASLMTGRYPVRYGMQYSVIAAGAPWGLPLDEKVMPQYMNDLGYESHMVGKWHLGSYNDASTPTHRGFKTHLGYLSGQETYYKHKNIEAVVDGKLFYDFGFGNETDYYDLSKTAEGVECEGEMMPSGDGGGVPLDDLTEACFTGTYSADAFLGRARQVVKEKTPWDEDPLFLYIAHQSVHLPIGPAPDDGFTDEEHALLDGVMERTNSETRVQFAGVLLYLDKRIGEFLDMLEEEGWLENSIIVVASDNGGCPTDGSSNYPLRGSKTSVFEGGTRVPSFIWSKSHFPEDKWGTEYDGMMHVTDWVPTLASAANGDLFGSAGPLDGVDHWYYLLTSAGGGGGDRLKGPRTEMLYNWDSYLLSSSTQLTENRNLTQGAFRVGDWKLLVNAFCSGYYSYDINVIESDPLLNSSYLCGASEQCEDCCMACQGNSEYRFGDRLVNLLADPREENNLIEDYPEIAEGLLKRALEVVYSDWKPSGYVEVDKSSYEVWENNDWWMVPWVDDLPPLAQQQQQLARKVNK